MIHRGIRLTTGGLVMFEHFPILTILLMVFGVVLFAAAAIWISVTLNVLWAIAIILAVVLAGFWIAQHRPRSLRHH